MPRNKTRLTEKRTYHNNYIFNNLKKVKTHSHFLLKKVNLFTILFAQIASKVKSELGHLAIQ